MCLCLLLCVFVVKIMILKKMENGRFEIRQERFICVNDVPTMLITTVRECQSKSRITGGQEYFKGSRNKAVKPTSAIR